MKLQKESGMQKQTNKKILVFRISQKDNLSYLCNIHLPVSKIRVAVIPAIGLFEILKI